MRLQKVLKDNCKVKQKIIKNEKVRKNVIGHFFSQK